VIPHRVHNFGTYFVGSQTWERRKLFKNEELAELLVRTILKYRDQAKYLLHDFVVMPDHLHVILTPDGITLERAMQLIKGGYSHAVGETGRKSLMIWQKGFTDHRIRDAEDYERHRLYLLMNPVRAGLSDSEQDYRWSSARREWRMDEAPQRLKPSESLAEARHG